MSFEDLTPERDKEQHIPRVFGFKIHDAQASNSLKCGEGAGSSSEKAPRVFIGESRGDTARYFDADLVAIESSRVREIMSMEKAAAAAAGEDESDDDRAVSQVGGKRANSLSDEDKALLGDSNSSKRTRAA